MADPNGPNMQNGAPSDLAHSHASAFSNSPQPPRATLWGTNVQEVSSTLQDFTSNRGSHSTPDQLPGPATKPPVDLNPNPNPMQEPHSWGAPQTPGVPHIPPPPFLSSHQRSSKGDDALAFDLEAGLKPEVKGTTRHQRWLERQAQKQGPWGEGLQGVYVLLWLIPVSGGLGYAFILPWIHPWALRLTFYVVVGVCLGLAMVCLYLVNQLDPGVVTPQPTKDLEVVAAESGHVTRLRTNGRAQWVRPPAGYTGPLDVGTSIRGWERYCSTCNIWRGPRVTHCSICGYCMQRFDHHCAVVGTCIAQNNHRFFVVFLMSTGVGSAVLFAASIILLVQRRWQGSHAWSDWHTYFGLLMTFYFCYLAFLLLFGCCHLCLLLCDLTSKQMAQRRIDEAFAGGFCSCLKNLVRVCCAPINHKRTVMAPYNISPPPAQVERHEDGALELEGGRMVGDRWKAHESRGEGSGKNAELDGSEDHVVLGDVAKGDVACGVDFEARAQVERGFQEEENRSVEKVAHLGPLFPGM